MNARDVIIFSDILCFMDWLKTVIVGTRYIDILNVIY